jgi:hypothetical protein
MSVAVFVGVVAAVVVVVALAARRGTPPTERADVQSGGLLAGRAGPVPWPQIYRVTMLTHHRRVPSRTEFAFVVECEDGRRCTLSSRDGAAQRFLAESHRLPGFSHSAVLSRLGEARSATHICFQRA